MRMLWASLIALFLLALAGCGNPPTCGTCPSGQACVHLNNGTDRCATLCGGDGGATCDGGFNCQPTVLVPPPPPGVMPLTNPDNNTVYACVPM